MFSVLCILSNKAYYDRLHRTYGCGTVDLSLTEEQTLIQDMARKFAQSELAPLAVKLDQGGDRPAFLANLSKLADLGFMGLNINAGHGGTEAGTPGVSIGQAEAKMGQHASSTNSVNFDNCCIPASASSNL